MTKEEAISLAKSHLTEEIKPRSSSGHAGTLRSTSSEMKMCAIVLSLIITLTVNLLAGGTWACGFRVIVQKDGKPVQLSTESTAICADSIHDLLISCSVDSTGNVATNQRWNDILASDSYIHLIGMEDFKMVIATKETITVREILLPLADNKWPDDVFVKEGNNIHAYCKYDPRPLQKIGSIPEMGFSKNPFSVGKGN
jgi:hypothetical protein